MQRLDAAGHYVSESAAHEPHADRTTFDLYCPAIGREVPESDLPSATVLRGHVERILIVTDYRVPGRLGTDLATQIHAINSTIPFIMLTGNPPRCWPTGSAPAASATCLPNRISIDQLAHAVYRAIHGTAPSESQLA